MKYRVPDWYRDAKFGIMIHWGLYSVPAFAPTDGGTISDNLSRHDWPHHFRNNPYAEWYQNSLRLAAPATVRHHRRAYKPGFAYERLAELFNAELDNWDPGAWADLFAEAGARYVVYVSKHHDGFLMWPGSAQFRDGYTTTRDTVGELRDAVRERNMKYGLYYSGLLDWTFQSDPIADFPDLLAAKTNQPYSDYISGHFSQLIEQHKPDILWNDIGLAGGVSRTQLFSRYRHAVPDGVLNDRWHQTSPFQRWLLRQGWLRRRVSETARRAFSQGKPMGRGDVATSEYGLATELRSRPWEAVRSIGNSFGLNREETEEDHLGGPELTRILADVVSKNGNLLLNVGPEPGGRIPPFQKTALLEVAAWLRINGEAVFGTRPWDRAEGLTDAGEPVRFTTRPGTLYAILLDRPARLTVGLVDIDVHRIPELTGPGSQTSTGAERFAVSVLGFEYAVQWRHDERVIEVRLPGSFVPQGPVVIAIRRVHDTREPQTIELYTDVIG